MGKIVLPDIFDYLDSVKYLRDCYEARHAADRWFSYRYIQSKAGIDPGYLFKVFQGSKPLPQKKVALLAELFGLNKRETEYFKVLVLFNRATSNEAIKLYFEKLMSFKEVSLRKITPRQYEYYTKWYYVAIRQILTYYKFSGDYKELASLTVPPITQTQAKKAVVLLRKLGFIKKSTDGTYTVTDRLLTTGDKWHSVAVRQFQKDTVALAGQALDGILKDHRDISTVTVTLSEKGFLEAKERIKQFRREMLELANRQEQPKGAYHINVQLFPIAKKRKGRSA